MKKFLLFAALLIAVTLSAQADVQHDYIIVGAPGELFGGPEWEPYNDYGLMQLNEDGLYEWSSDWTRLTPYDNPLADQGPGHVEFKIIIDHNWNTSYPPANYSIAIPNVANYMLKATFDPETNAITGELIREYIYSVCGAPAELFGMENAWDPTVAPNMIFNTENGLYEWSSAMTELDAGTVKFKVIQDHSWDVCFPENDYEVTVPKSGVYVLIVTYDPETHEINASLILIDEIITGIENINVDNNDKISRYNILGQPVNENYKGIVIENGVKKIQK